MSDFARWLQTRLVAHGARIAVDGLPGAETRKALAAFQRIAGLPASGEATEGTMAALRLLPEGKDSGPAPITIRPAWLAELERRKGLHEVRDASLLSKWLKSDGRTLGDPRKLPWCGDAIQTCIALTLPQEPALANPYLARNWLQFGRQCQPKLGAVMVFWRGSRTGTDGHVALYLGEDRDSFEVIGGNQSNAIGVARIAKDRLLGARWPRSDNSLTFSVERALNAPLSTNEA